MVKDISGLLKPRYIVMLDYPKSTHKVGDIIELPNEDYRYADEERTFAGEELFDEYPNAYRKLQWYEFRTVDQMPMFLKQASSGGITTFHKIIGWDMKYMKGQIDERHCCDLMLYKPEYNYQPVTENEFNNFKSTNNI